LYLWSINPRYMYHYLGFGSLIALGCCLAFFNFVADRRRVEPTANGIAASSPWRGRTEILWHSVSRIECRGLFRDRLAILGHDGQVIVIDSFMKGLQTLIYYFELHLDARIYADAVSAFTKANEGTLKFRAQPRAALDRDSEH